MVWYKNTIIFRNYLIVYYCLFFTAASFSQGTRLWGTYYGGTSDDRARNIATDASGNVFLAGATMSSVGIASGGFQNTYGGPYDAYLVKFDATGNRLWATYYGGTASDEGLSVACDSPHSENGNNFSC